MENEDIIDTALGLADQDYVFALRLIGGALKAKTSAFNPAIEYLLSQSAIYNKDAETFLERTWPGVRNSLNLRDKERTANK